jgi:hypothetical protein
VPGRAAASPGDTVLADGGRPADVTAAEFGPQLVTSLLQWGAQTTGERLRRRPAALSGRRTPRACSPWLATQQLTLT